MRTDDPSGRSRSVDSLADLVFSLLIALMPLVLAAPVAGQLRPLDPLEWRDVTGPEEVSVRLGIGVYTDHSASLAGTRGRLFELGSFRGTWRLGRVAVEVSGTAARVFRDDSVVAEPVGPTRPADGSRRVDAGDQRVSTVILLTDGSSRGWDAALRFGVRLPTTDNVVGLERDQTDFFATVAGRRVFGPVEASAEVGVGVMGTRNRGHEQVDPLLFAVRAQWRGGWLRPDLALVGQHDTRTNPDLRGNEDLGEVRLGVTGGDRGWFRLGVVGGWRSFSPGLGVTLEAGVRH